MNAEKEKIASEALQVFADILDLKVNEVMIFRFKNIEFTLGKIKEKKVEL